MIWTACFSCLTTVFALDGETKQRIDGLLAKAQTEKINLFSEKRCTADCLGKSFKETVIQKSDEDLIVFVSNAMPKQALRDLATAAKMHKNAKKHIRLVIQGMVKGSMLETAKLVEEIGYPLDIDPKLFEAYQITHVPVFMKQKEGKTYAIKGNVTLDFAIFKLEERS